MTSALREAYLRDFPDFPWLADDSPVVAERLMRRLGWLEADESLLGVARAGEGNMNLTLRLKTSRRSVVLKQSRPWVEKYDEIEAPWERILVEQRYYRRISEIPNLALMMPKLLGADADARVLLLEDLDPARDMTDLYAGAPLDEALLSNLALYLKELHEATLADRADDFENREMRGLNHAHIFHLPLTGELSVPLDAFEAGLGEAAEHARQDAEFVKLVRETGERYLALGSCLVHGDYFPGSWLRTRQGVRIIDPEFCFHGDPEFDLGVALAHFRLANRSESEAGRFLVAAGGEKRSTMWMARYAATETMRRLIGVAQLPIARTEGWRAHLLERSIRTIKAARWEDLWS